MERKSVNKKGVSVSQRNSMGNAIHPGFEVDPYKLDPELQQELDSKGLVARFVNIKSIEMSGGFHPKGWRIYKRDNKPTDADFLYGRSPDGITRRGDTVLAVKTKEDASNHRRYLDQLADQSRVKNLMKRHKQEFREHVRNSGLDQVINIRDDND